MKTFLLSLACFAVADSVLAVQPEAPACVPTPTVVRTDFSRYAQELGFGGSLVIGLMLGNQGEVLTARVIQSSGHRALDSSALTSARRYWRFNVSSCNATERGREFLQSVTYRPTRGLQFAGATNHKSRRNIQASATDNRCTSTRQSHETTVVACRDSGEALAAVRSQSPTP